MTGQTQPVASWFQALSNVAVVVGIVALIFELNQTRDLARAETLTNTYIAAMTRNLALMGESPHEVLAKTIFAPDTLTEADAVVINQFYTVVIINWRTLKDREATGFFGDQWMHVVREEAFHFNTPTGRKWWSRYREFSDPEIRDVVDAALANIDLDQTRTFLEALLPDRQNVAPQRE